MIPTQVPKGPTVQDFITPPRIEADAVEVIQLYQGYLHNMLTNEMHFVYTKVSLWQTAATESLLTTEKEVDVANTIKSKSTSARNIFAKSNASSGSTNYVSTDQLLRTRNQKKNQQV